MSETSRAAVAAVITSRIAAVHAKDQKALLAPYAPDVTTFDVVPPLRNVGKSALTKKLDGWFDGYDGAIETELRDLNVTASEDVAFAHALCRTSGALTNGGKVSMWYRLTVCLEKRGGDWVIVHEHTSDPLDPKSGKGLTDLMPE